jgi:hypothetical protein
MALIDGPPADYEDEAAADKDAAPTAAANISSSASSPAPAATVVNDAPMDNGMQRARSSSVEDWEKHELEMEALLASLQTDIIDIDTGDADADGGSLVDSAPLPLPSASADKAPPDVVAAPAPHTERHEPPAEPAEAMANQRSHDHTDELDHTHEWVRSASDGEGGGIGAMSAKEREIEELQRKLRELEERLTAGSSDSPGGSLLLPSLLPPSFASTPARLPTSSLRPLPASHSPSTPTSSSLPSLSTPSLPSAPSPSFTAASQHHHYQASPLAPPSSAASPYYPPPPRAGAGSGGDTRLAAEVIDGLLADNPAVDLDLLVPGEQKPQTPTRVPTSGGGGGGGGGAVSLPPDRRDLFAASLYLTPAALPSTSASSASSAQRRGRTGSALSPSSLLTASSSSFVPSSPLSLSASSLSSTSTSSLASSASAATQRDRRRSPDAAGAEQQQQTTTASLSGVGAGQRRQVLFHLHKRGTAADQNYLCAGCSAQFGSCTPPQAPTHTNDG